MILNNVSMSYESKNIDGFETKWNTDEEKFAIIKEPVNDKELYVVAHKYIDIRKELIIEYLLQTDKTQQTINAFSSRRNSSLNNIKLEQIKNILQISNSDYQINSFEHFKKEILSKSIQEQQDFFRYLLDYVVRSDNMSILDLITNHIQNTFLPFNPLKDSLYSKETFTLFIENIVEKSKFKSRYDVHARIFEFLVFLHRHEYILFPRYVLLPKTRKNFSIDNRFVSCKTLEICEQIIIYRPSYKIQLFSLFLTVYFTNVDKISINFFYECYYYLQKNDITKKTFYRTFGLLENHSKFEFKRPSKQSDLSIVVGKKDFQYWYEIIDMYIKNKFVKVSKTTYPVLKWIEYLSIIADPPLTPEKIIRKEHINDIFNDEKLTFIKWLSQNGNLANTNNNALSQVRQMFNFYHQEYNSDFTNPITESDSFSFFINSKTNKQVLPDKLIKLLIEIIMENDFEFPRSLALCQARNIYNKELNVIEKEVFYPGLSVLLILLLTVPIRSIQGRMLDSGFGDEFIYDYEQKKMVENHSLTAIKGRQQGVLQLINDSFSEKMFLSLWITTNKTSEFLRFNGSAIPYCPEYLEKALMIQQKWIKNYGPKYKKAINLSDMIVETDYKPSLKMYQYMPSFFPLFPQVSHNVLQDKTAIGKRQLDTFYYYCLEELEKRFNQRSQYKLKLVAPRYQNKNTNMCYFSIHSLRASGITNLIAAGVPIEIVSEVIAMHSSLLMTLYYSKAHLSTTKDVLDKYYSNGENNYNLTQIVDLFLYQNKDRWDDILLFNSEGKESLASNLGIHEITLTGICPGISCADSNTKQKDCLNCNYYITGPAFLPGQVVEANTLMIKIKDKSTILKDIKLNFLSENETMKKKRLEDRILNLEKELNSMLISWGMRYEKIKKSLELYNNYEQIFSKQQEETTLAPIFGTLETEQLILKIESSSQFRVLSNICEYIEYSSEFYEELIELKLERFLNMILSQNALEPFLFKLPKSIMISAMSQFSKLLLNIYGDEGVEDLMVGKKKLDQVDISEILPFIQQITYNKEL